ncbi:hypothetical protein BS78_10G033400 [Paspalum vaginatum]|nr:hypothetical protein BS78_10G033400 [Paspalum vaginatum]
MRKAKRGGDDLTRSFRKNSRASKKKLLVSGHFLQDDRSHLADELKSHLSKSVANITLYNGDTILFSCSGIAIECKGRYLTRFLTSASLARALDATNEDHGDLKIDVRHEGNEVYMGVMAEFDLDHNFAVVNVHGSLKVQVVAFQHALEILPHGAMLNVVLDGDSVVSQDDEDLDCKILEAWEGGPLLSVAGEVVGMNAFFTMRRPVFLSWGTVLKHLEHYWTSVQKKTSLAQSKSNLKVYRFGARPIGDKSNSHPEVHGDLLNQEQLEIDSMGYPKLPSSMTGAGMVLVNTFEETFGDIYGEGIWRKFSKGASNINRNVVALASFNGEKRFFACTGFFIEWNGSTIILTSASLVRNSGDENRIIKVLLNNQCREGMLQHYSLHYNIALVSVKDYPALRPSNTRLCWNNVPFEVAAVGRCFNSGALMATGGDVFSWKLTLDCCFLTRTTCKITKAGIGGPLVALDGDFVGMNFYDTRIETPFMFWDEICKILAWFETKSKLSEVGNDSDCSGVSFWKMDNDYTTRMNRWPVPMPRWCRPDDVGEDKSDDDDFFGFEPKSWRTHRYGYFEGQKVSFGSGPDDWLKARI